MANTKQAESAGQPRPYREGAFRSRQPHTTDLIPKRFWVFALLVLVFGLLTGGINVLGRNHARWSDAIGAADLAAIDMASRGNTAAWLSSTLLTLAAVFSWQIYGLRRHKVDDYRGRYRLWFWTGAALLLASIDATAGLHQMLRGALVRVSGTTLFGDGSIWWIGTFAVLFGAIAVRMGIEMRRSRAAVAALCVVVASYTVAALAKLNLVAGDSAMLFAANGAMVGHVAVLFCAAIYARYVYFEANPSLMRTSKKSVAKSKASAAAGQQQSNAAIKQQASTNANRKATEKADDVLPPKAAHSKKKNKTKTFPAASEQKNDNPATVKFQRAAQPNQKKTTSTNGQSSPAKDAPSPESNVHPSRLSKSQRRHLRKQQRRDEEQQRQQKAA